MQLSGNVCKPLVGYYLPIYQLGGKDVSEMILTVRRPCQTSNKEKPVTIAHHVH